MKTLNYSVPIHSSNMFHYVGTLKTFVADRSDFTGTRLCDRIFGDAYDVGFWMESAKTGARKMFVWFDEDEEVVRFTDDTGLKVSVFND